MAASDDHPGPGTAHEDHDEAPGHHTLGPFSGAAGSPLACPWRGPPEGAVDRTSRPPRAPPWLSCSRGGASFVTKRLS